MKSGKEIKALGTQLEKTNIAAWASKVEDKDASSSLKYEKSGKIAIEMRTTAWEDAEKT